jgi:NAD+ diphosphatase
MRASVGAFMSNRILADPLISLGYVGSSLDRISEQRGDAALIAKAMAHKDARVHALAGDIILLKKRGETLNALLSPAEARLLGDPIESVLIGLKGEAAHTGIAISPETAARAKESGEFAAIDLRSVAVQGLANEHLPSLATAKSLLIWNEKHRFCSNCGTETKSTQAGWRRECLSCGAHHFPRTDPCVIMLAVDNDRCLLGRSPRFLPNMWSCLAGFVEPGESFEEAVRREMFEESGLKIGRVSYFASQPWPFPMSVMIGFHAEAKTTELNIDWKELDGARWFSRDEVKLMLAGKHPDGLFTPPPVAIAHHIIRAYAEKGAGVLGS